MNISFKKSIHSLTITFWYQFLLHFFHIIHFFIKLNFSSIKCIFKSIFSYRFYFSSYFAHYFNLNFLYCFKSKIFLFYKTLNIVCTVYFLVLSINIFLLICKISNSFNFLHDLYSDKIFTASLDENFLFHMRMRYLCFSVFAEWAYTWKSISSGTHCVHIFLAWSQEAQIGTCA